MGHLCCDGITFSCLLVCSYLIGASKKSPVQNGSIGPSGGRVVNSSLPWAWPTVEGQLLFIATSHQDRTGGWTKGEQETLSAHLPCDTVGHVPTILRPVPVQFGDRGHPLVMWPRTWGERRQGGAPSSREWAPESSACEVRRTSRTRCEPKLPATDICPTVALGFS